MLRHTVKLTLNYDGVMLEICLDKKSQCTQEGLNCESLPYKVLTNPCLDGFGVPEFTIWRQ